MATTGTGAAPPQRAADTLVASLLGHDVDRVFCVAGESYLPVLDALHDVSGIDVVTCRHEGSAGFAALADAKLTGRAGVCLVSRGPGATNAAIAVHAAAEDATPLVVLVGGVPTHSIDREAFQHIDCGRHFGEVAKGVWTLHDPRAIGEFMRRAFRIAESGTPGPVVLTLPENLLDEPDAAGVPAQRTPLARTELASADLAEVRRLLGQAERPVLLAGSMVDTPVGRRLLREVAERHNLPVIASNKNQHLLDNRHPCYAGHLHNATQPSQLAEFATADLLLAVGTRLDHATTRGKRFPRAPEPGQPLVHVYPDAARIGRYVDTSVGVAADPVGFLAQLGTGPSSDPSGRRSEWISALHRIEADKAVWEPVEAADGVVFGEVVAALDELTGGVVTVVVDSGTFTSWTYRYLRFAEGGRLLGISSSAMGFSVGAGVSAALRSGGAPTVAVVGDGGFLMNGGELATACDLGAPVVFVVSNNNSYGTIRLHQEKDYPGRTVATDLANPDFARMAESFGALGLTAVTPAQVRPCLRKALDHHGPAVVEIRTSLHHITPYRTLS
ncbi:thiamine pyrophosphate-dependent enzyme [Saccharopolyspora sp. NPDC003752]